MAINKGLGKVEPYLTYLNRIPYFDTSPDFDRAMNEAEGVLFQE